MFEKCQPQTERAFLFCGGCFCSSLFFFSYCPQSPPDFYPRLRYQRQRVITLTAIMVNIRAPYLLGGCPTTPRRVSMLANGAQRARAMMSHAAIVCSFLPFFFQSCLPPDLTRVIPDEARAALHFYIGRKIGHGRGSSPSVVSCFVFRALLQ